jgi:4-azaleucine resistance transporter AzlC
MNGSRSDFRDALRDVAPAMIAAAPIGLLFGAVAVSKGMSPLEAMLMSGLVFAGGAQLAAVEMWTYPLPIAALVFTTLLINARFVLMGVSLAPKVAHLPRGPAFLGFWVLADENWALAERRAAGGPVSGAYFFGMGAVFMANWLAWSGMGAFAGPLLGDPRRFGADFAFTAIFIGLLVGFQKGPRTGAVVGASGCAAASAHLAFGSPWHVLAGALAGVGVAAALHRDEEAGA